ncbi:hypothetical protein SEEN2RVB_20477 [Salmonella enterica subsp. enterica serovar Newport str. A182RVB]|nr:hypothetical protein SEEN2RVB_20477 [Salmonella enterica subsp. enterica serovar Newport str. A182RVB]
MNHQTVNVEAVNFFAAEAGRVSTAIFTKIPGKKLFILNVMVPTKT